MKIEIKDEIAEVLKKRVEEKADFDNVEAYVNDILSQVVERLNQEQADKSEEAEYSEEDEEKVKERLKSLGYMD